MADYFMANCLLADDDYSPDDHKQFGYGRIETFNLDRQLDFIQYKRHVFLCHGNSHSWPHDFAGGDPGLLSVKLLSAFKSREEEVKSKTLLTICEASDKADLKEGDVLIFPDMTKYSLMPDDVHSFVEDVLVKETTWCTEKKMHWKNGSYVFVSAHGDKKNEVCGGLVMEKLKELTDRNKLENYLFSLPCSNLGVPDYAANIIIFSQDRQDKVDGHWYTYVCPIELPKIIDSHIVHGKVYRSRWRGKMGNDKLMEICRYPSWWWVRGESGPIANIELDYGIRMVGWRSKLPRRVPKSLECAGIKTLPPTKLVARYGRHAIMCQCDIEGQMPMNIPPRPSPGFLINEEGSSTNEGRERRIEEFLRKQKIRMSKLKVID